MAPIDDRNNYAGPFTWLGVNTKPNQISDELSNTIFVGEVRVTCGMTLSATEPARCEERSRHFYAIWIDPQSAELASS